MDERLNAVKRMQDYIGAHLYEKITLAALARASMFSPWHAHRLFTGMVGITPAEYIRKLRLSHSALKLRDEHAKVADVAFEIGFGSVDGYQRAFLREFGVNPHKYASQPIPVYLFTPYGIKYKRDRKEQDMESTRNIFIQLIEKQERLVIAKRGVKADDYWSYCEEVGCDIWELLKSMKSLCGEPVCLWLPEAFRAPNTSEYVQGIEAPLDYAGEIPEGFDIIRLPKAQYLMFQGEPFDEANFQQAISELWNAIEKYDPAVVGYAWDDSNPRIQLEPVGARGYIELKAVKKLA